MKQLIKDLFMFVLFITVMCLIYLILSFTVSIALGAPAPLRKKQPSNRLALIGRWNLTYYENEYSMYLHPDGRYICIDNCYNEWKGLWCEKDDVIYVREYKTMSRGIPMKSERTFSWSVPVNTNKDNKIRMWRKLL